MRTLRTALAAAALLTVSLSHAQAPVPSATPAAVSPAPSAPATPGKKLSYTDDYRISVDGGADSDGEIIFRVTPKGGTAQEVKVAVTKGTGENDVAGTIKKAFEQQIGTKHYNIEIEDGENVIIERSMGSKDISLVLVSSTVKGANVKVHRD